MKGILMTNANRLIARMIDRSASTLFLALEPVDDAEFFETLPTGFSAAWTVGHLACVADLFSSWYDSGRMLFDAEFHAVFNETAVTGPGTETVLQAASKAASVDRDRYPKDLLLLRLRQALIKALRVLNAFKTSRWDAPGPPGIPVSVLTGGAMWEILGVHIYWHLGELAGSMPRFAGTYSLNILPHYLYIPPAAGRRVRAARRIRRGWRRVSTARSREQ